LTTLFIADLHLDDTRPETTERFLQFLRDDASSADALYILGDLFEYWLGDDVPSKIAKQVAVALESIASKGVGCFFMHGNRDFLLRDGYAKQAGLSMLPEEYVVDLYGEHVLLMHGDSMCTDDLPYQQFRNTVRNPAWQDDFLCKSPQERLQVAMQARDASAEHKGHASMNIMDVNSAAVIAAFNRHGVHKMIHGHTHRPARHDLEVNGVPAQRFVLGDWYEQSSILRVSPGKFEL